MWCFTLRFGGATFPRISRWNWKTYCIYISRTITSDERNYSQIKKESSAIVYTIKKFHQFLYGRYFTVITDHKPLLSILSEEKGNRTLASSCIQRWGIISVPFNYTLRYGLSLKNANVHCFSRFPNSGEKEGSILDNNIYLTELYNFPIKCVL